jgi:hypothetical protein
VRTTLVLILIVGCSSSESTPAVDAGKSDSSAATDTSSATDSAGDAPTKTPQQLCDSFCANVGTVCPKFAMELEAETVDCKTECMNPASPAGYRECIAAAKNCDELTECKMKF